MDSSEMELHSVCLENIQLGVSRRFFKEAREMICDYMADKSIVTLKGDDDISLTWLCFLEKGENEDAVASFKDNARLFEHTPHITLVPTPTLDKYREIETVTGVKMDAYSGDMEDVFSVLADGELDGIPNFQVKRFQKMAPISAAIITFSSTRLGELTISPPIVFATPVETIAPRKFRTAAIAIA